MADENPFQLNREDLGRIIPPVSFDPMANLRHQAEQAQAGFDAAMDEINEANAEKERQRELAEFREDRVAALAEAAERRGREQERRDKVLFWVTLASLIFAIVAAVTGIIAIS